VSYWLSSLRNYYCDEKVFPGCSFVIKLDAKLKSNQIFMYRVVLTYKSYKPVILTNKHYYGRDCIVSDSNGFKKFVLLNDVQANNKFIKSCTAEQLLQHGIIFPDTEIRFEFDVHKKIMIDYDQVINTHVGDFEYFNNTIKVLNDLRLQSQFDSTTQPLYNCTLSPVNKKPTTITTRMIADENIKLVPSVSEQYYYDILKLISDDNQKLLNIAIMKRIVLKQEHTRLSEKLLEITATITELNKNILGEK
jgi:hypothetical protein